MYKTDWHRFFRGAETADEFNGETKGFQLPLDFVDRDIIWDALQNDFEGTFFRERKCVEFRSFGH